MKKKKVSIILFYDKSGNILLQDRKKISKRGEEYGFFGGHIEENETPEETLRRELKEELGISIEDLEDFRFFKNFKLKLSQLNLDLERYTFIAKIPDIKSLKVSEGRLALMKFEDSFNLKMVPGDVEILKEAYEYLKNKNLIFK
jgi:8-oxo-dGTP diphosphatase